MSSHFLIADSHCHLDFQDFSDDIDQVVNNANDAGIHQMVTICTRPRELDKTYKIAEKFHNVYFAMGLHPHWVTSEPHVTVDELLEAAQHSKMVGIGESGLDYHYTKESALAQRQSFITHIEAARESGLPLIVHARDADVDMIEILTTEFYRGHFSCIMHCYSSGKELAHIAVDLGFFVSMSGIITFRNAGELREIFSSIPINQILVETDAPYLAPVPFRGKRNEPAYTVYTARVGAELFKMEYEEFANHIIDNFNRAFPKIKND